MIKKFYRQKGKNVLRGVTVFNILFIKEIPRLNGNPIFRLNDYTVIETAIKPIEIKSTLIKKIWREDIYKWESKIKLWLFTYYKYELRDGAIVNTNYSILRK